MLNLTIEKGSPIVLLIPEYGHSDGRSHTISIVMLSNRGDGLNCRIALSLPPSILVLRCERWRTCYRDYPDAVYAQTGKRVRDLGPTDDVFQLPVLTQKKSYAHRKETRS